jgi:hypothetical protein
MNLVRRGGVLLVIAVLICGCGMFSTASPSAISSQSPTASASPSIAVPSSVAPSPSASPDPNACGSSPSSYPAPPYAFKTISIPSGSDICQDLGPFLHPHLNQLENDGPLVAFTATEEAGGREDLWYGDLRDGSVKMIYSTPKVANADTGLGLVQLVDGTLVWLEFEWDVPLQSATQWWVKRMDVTNGKVQVLAHSMAPSKGGAKYVSGIGFDGSQIALSETLANGKFQIELLDSEGRHLRAIPVSLEVYGFAFVPDGLIYTAGKYDDSIGAFGQMHTFHWTEASGSQEIGADAFEVAAEDKLAAWVVDVPASQYTTGMPQAGRLFATNGDYSAATPISPVADHKPTIGIRAISVGSDHVAWWELEDDGCCGGSDGRIDLTVWKPGWQSPVQIETGGESYYLSVKNGWLVWFEMFGRDTERLRAVPLATLDAEITQ